jgi:hypothetical protein
MVASGEVSMSVSEYILNPPLAVAVVLLVVLLVGLRKVLTKANFWIVITASILSLLAGEALCRFLDLGDPRIAVWKEDRAKEEIYAYVPNGKLVYRYPDNPRNYFGDENEVIGHINSKGFRGQDNDLAMRNDATKIALLGDSFTLGVGVRDEHTLPTQLSHELERKGIDALTFNFGVSSSSTRYQIKLLKDYVLRFQPDVVIIVVFLNDAGRSATIDFLSRAHVLKRYRQKSYFLNAIVGSIERPILHNRMVRHYQEGYQETSDGWSSIKSSLRHGKLLSKRHDFRFIVAVYPVLYGLDESYPFQSIHRKLEAYCQVEDIEFIDLLEGFLGQQDTELWVHRTDQHPNEVAHRLAAQFLADQLTTRPTIK